MTATLCCAPTFDAGDNAHSTFPILLQATGPFADQDEWLCPSCGLPVPEPEVQP